MSRPDVALVGPHPPPGRRHAGRSGVVSYTGNLAAALAAAGLRVTVVAPREPGVPADAIDGGVRVSRPFDRGPGAVPRALAAARATGAPVTHLQHEVFLYGGPTSVPGALSGLAAARGRRQRTVVTLHHVVDPALVDATFTRLHRVPVAPLAARAGLVGVQRTIAALADRTIVHEPAFAAHVPGAVVIPHGLERVTVPDRAAARQRLAPGSDDRLLVLCFGFVAPYKGLELALAAAERARPAVHLVVAGGTHPRLAEAGDDYDARLRRAHAGTAQFTGWVAEEDVSGWFAAADVALFPYPHAFSASGALALALAHRTPVLLSPALVAATAAPPALTAPPEPAALAAVLRRLAADPRRRDQLAATSGELAEGRWWPDVAARHRDLYASLAPARWRASGGG